MRLASAVSFTFHGETYYGVVTGIAGFDGNEWYDVLFFVHGQPNTVNGRFDRFTEIPLCCRYDL